METMLATATVSISELKKILPTSSIVTMGRRSPFSTIWRKLDKSIRELFKKRLAERLAAPRVESARLVGLADCYKIKLRDAGYIASLPP